MATNSMTTQTIGIMIATAGGTNIAPTIIPMVMISRLIENFDMTWPTMSTPRPTSMIELFTLFSS